jgi:hypothetical protein
MAPPSATEPATVTVPPSGNSQEAGVEKAKVKMGGFPKPPVFEDKYKEREYLKGRLAAAFRIFGKNGYDEGRFLLLPGYRPLHATLQTSTFRIHHSHYTPPIPDPAPS